MRILFICHDINKPTGGIKQIYRQVDVLNNNGFNSYVLHEKNNFRCTWFINATRVVSNRKIFKKINNLNRNKVTFKSKIFKNLKEILYFINVFTQKNEIIIDKDDILVFPEVYGPYICEIYPSVKKVIYNQGAYQTFFHYDLDLDNTKTPYLDKNLMGVIVNSENAKQYIKYAFPKLDVYRVHYGIDKENFNLNLQKKQQIAFMPRRLKVDLIQVVNILKFRGVLKNWKIIPIQNMNEKEVATTFKESAIFLSFSINEGFGMPPAEAMACGCIVVGYPGKGGEEFFKEEFSYPILDRNIQEYVLKLEKILLTYEKDKEQFNKKAKLASDFILEEYAMEVEEKDIINVWSKILEKNA